MRISDWSSDVCSSDLMTVFGILIALAVWPNAAFIASAYTGSAATLAMAIPALALSCLMYWPDRLQVVAAASLRARGGVWLPTSTHLSSEGRRVGKECGRTCKSGWSPDPYKNKK